MLALSRRIDETIVIDGGIEVKVLKIRGNRVQLGIEAPRQVGIRRKELPDGGPADDRPRNTRD